MDALFEAKNRPRSKENESEPRLVETAPHTHGFERVTRGRAASIQSDFMHISILMVNPRTVIRRAH